MLDILMDTIGRFTRKSNLFERFRWDYDPRAIDSLLKVSQIQPQAVVADIGSGTGTLSKQLVQRVKTVYAIEPNLEMREIAERSLGNSPSFHSLVGTAEATTLPENSVDLITVGRAIHWFNPHEAKNEFFRILKPGGWLAILQVPCLDLELLAAVKSIQIKENGWDTIGDKSQLKKVPFRFYFGSDDFIFQQFPDTIQESWDEFIGRLVSISSAPDVSNEHFPNFECDAKKIFERFSKDGFLPVHIATEYTLGRVTPRTD